ncbi:MAG: hypothetical protein PHT59_05980, partial [Candidatus Omnitrophica bacterium]|nr:hypothetical protein [Candidatus Omnitrophota bacterium]
NDTPLTSQALIKVYDASDLNVSDVSDNLFKLQGSITVNAPNGGEPWQAATTENVTWGWTGNISYVKIYYSKDAAHLVWTPLTAGSVANTGTYPWNIPVEAVSTTVKIRVEDASDSEAFDESNNNFMVRCRFVLTSPIGGEQLRVGRTHNITWNKVGNPAAVLLEYSPDNFLDPMNTVVIDGAASAVSPYPWLVPPYLCNTVRVRISDAADSGATDKSGANFRITGDVHVDAPNGGEDWVYNSIQTITWTTHGAISDVKIEYTYDGATYHLIKAVGNTGSTTWQVPDHVSDTCRVRISDLADSSADDTSDAPFNIVPVFTLTSPVGNEVWTVNDMHQIGWTCSGTVTNVRLDCTLNGGTFDHPITASTTNDGSFDWQIPDWISSQVKVRIGNAVTPNAFVASPANFKIRGAFQVISPNGDESWQISQPETITWLTTGT